MSPAEKRKLERVRYWQGQLLRSRDFNDIHAVEEQRRWWHNRAIHNAYGIHRDPDVAPGFQASINTDQTSVSVTAGLAYDIFGRELLLETNQTVSLPAGGQDDDVLVLLARYRLADEDDRRSGGFAAVLCANQGPVRPAFVELVWKRAESFTFADGVLLIAVRIAGGKATAADLPFPLSITKPLARPQIGSGSTVPGNTAWELWTYGNARSSTVLGVQTTIDTSAAGFTDSPCYFAWLQGSVFNQQTLQLAPALFPSIAEEKLDSFVFRIALTMPAAGEILARAPAAAINYATPREFGLFAHQQNLYVNWIGCQKNASAPVLALLLGNPELLFGLNALQMAALAPGLNLFATVLNRLNKL